MNQSWPRAFSHHEAAFALQRVAAKKLLQQRLPFTDGHHGALGKRPSELLVKDTDGSAAKNGSGLGMVTTGVLEPFTNETLVPTKLAVMTSHQAKSAERTMQTLQGVLRVKDFERVLKRIATTAINRRVDLNVPPRKHQQRGLELINGVQQNPLDIKDRQGCQIKNALGQPWKTLVQVVGQIDRTDRKDRIAGQADQQHPLLSWRQGCCSSARGR